MHIRNFYILLALISLTFSAVAQKPATDSLEQNLRRHVEYLASQKLEGRRTGEHGATAAANYVADQFTKFKLKPGNRSTFLQPFPYVAGVTLGTGNALRILPTDPARENRMDIGINWMPLGYSPNIDIASTEVAFAGFGVVSRESNYDDYAGLDVRDKIVLLFDSTPDAGNPHSAFARFDIHTKANIAKDKGAKAIILIAADNDFKNDRLSRLSYDRTLGETALPVVGITRQQGAELLGKDEKELAAVEEWLSKKTNSPSNPQAETRPVGSVSLAVVANAQLRINLVKKQV